MIEKDTIRLLRECDAGIKMGVKSIDDVLGHVKSPDLLELLNACKDEHAKLDHELQGLLDQYGDEVFGIGNLIKQQKSIRIIIAKNRIIE